jgi:hypothetical protein
MNTTKKHIEAVRDTNKEVGLYMDKEQTTTKYLLMTSRKNIK